MATGEIKGTSNEQAVTECYKNLIHVDAILIELCEDSQELKEADLQKLKQMSKSVDENIDKLLSKQREIKTAPVVIDKKPQHKQTNQIEDMFFKIKQWTVLVLLYVDQCSPFAAFWMRGTCDAFLVVGTFLTKFLSFKKSATSQSRKHTKRDQMTKRPIKVVNILQVYNAIHLPQIKEIQDFKDKFDFIIYGNTEQLIYKIAAEMAPKRNKGKAALICSSYNMQVELTDIKQAMKKSSSTRGYRYYVRIIHPQNNPTTVPEDTAIIVVLLDGGNPKLEAEERHFIQQATEIITGGFVVVEGGDGTS